jgi:hypothetical protein
MTTKKNTLLNERVIRRWGKLANMPALTENWLDEQDDLEDEEFAAEDEVAAGEAEMEAGGEAEVSVEEEAAVARIVNAVVDAIADETGVAIEVEEEAGDEAAMDDMDAGMDASDALDDEADEEMDDADAPAMRDPYSRKDLGESSGRGKIQQAGAGAGAGYQRDDAEDDESLGARDGAEKDKKQSMKDRRKESRGAKNEDLNLDVIDDENLTEAVLKRVVERLLRARRK